MTWLIGGGVVALLLLAGVDALRSSFGDTPAPASGKTSGSGTVTETTGKDMSPAVQEYVSQAQMICGRASSELLRHGVPGDGLDELAGWHATAARAAEESLTQLRALPPPAGQALPDHFYAAAKHVIDLLRRTAVAARAGDGRRARTLSFMRIGATHEKDRVADRLSARWHLAPAFLQACSLMLPA
jgi:hypothetical protein